MLIIGMCKERHLKNSYASSTPRRVLLSCHTRCRTSHGVPYRDTVHHHGAHRTRRCVHVMLLHDSGSCWNPALGRIGSMALGSQAIAAVTAAVATSTTVCPPPACQLQLHQLQWQLQLQSESQFSCSYISYSCLESPVCPPPVCQPACPPPTPHWGPPGTRRRLQQ